MAFKHREQIDHIRSFYQTVTFATTRTGMIVKTAVETSSAAASIRNNWRLPTNDYNNIVLY